MKWLTSVFKAPFKICLHTNLPQRDYSLAACFLVVFFFSHFQINYLFGRLKCNKNNQHLMIRLNFNLTASWADLDKVYTAYQFSIRFSLFFFIFAFHLIRTAHITITRNRVREKQRKNIKKMKKSQEYYKLHAKIRRCTRQRILQNLIHEKHGVCTYMHFHRELVTNMCKWASPLPLRLMFSFLFLHCEILIKIMWTKRKHPMKYTSQC